MNIVLCSREDESRALSHGIVLCTPEEADFLMHYRTPNSKNGVRLYQNKDGSLTPLGRIHYGVGKGDRAQKKADKAEQKAEKAQAKLAKVETKYDKAVLKTNSFFGNKEKQFEKMESAKRMMEIQKAKTDLLNKKAQKLSDKAEKARVKEEEGKRQLEEDRKLIEENANKPKETVKDRFEAMMYPPELRGKSKEEKKAWEEAENKKFEKESRLEQNMLKFDKLSTDEKKEFGDELLEYCYKNSKEIHDKIWHDGKFDKDAYTKMKETHEYDGYDELSVGLTNLIYDKVGSWNAGYFKPGSKAEKAYSDFADAGEKEWNYRDEVKNKLGIRNDTFRMSDKETKRLSEALSKDSVWKEINEASKKAEDDLCGAILQELGFSDTPENRHMIIDFAFID